MCCGRYYLPRVNLSSYLSLASELVPVSAYWRTGLFVQWGTSLDPRIELEQKLPSESTTLYWHLLEMAGMNKFLWMCEIIPVVISTSWVFGFINSFCLFFFFFFFQGFSTWMLFHLKQLVPFWHSGNMELLSTNTDWLDASHEFLQDKLQIARPCYL